jgi:signal transduction histidine kinase
MRRYVQRAIRKLKKLDPDQLEGFIAELARENEQLEVVLDSLTDGVMVADLRNNLIFASRPAERLLPLYGFLPGQQPMWEAIAHREISAFVRSTLINLDSATDREFTLAGAGEPRILSLSIGPLVQNGKIQGSILTVRDVSEKRLGELRLRRAESLASLTTLAAGVAHEIKNPLGSIGIHIQLIQRLITRQSCDVPAEVPQYLKIITEEVERLNEIVVDFLFAVRPMDLHKESGNLNHVVHDLLAFMQYELSEAKVAVEERLDGALPDCEFDERYVKQALLNIVKNAISAMPGGGTLMVASHRKGNEAVLSLTDTGIGMSEEVQRKIFEPFYTTKDFGSGLGLTLVYKIMKEHGGDIAVNSREGKGSSFTLSFPLPQGERPLLCWEPGPDEGCEE